MGDALPRSTRDVCELQDPQLNPPPRNEDLIVVTNGGRLTTGPWRDEYIAWGYFPKLPATVKERLRRGAA